MAISLSVNFRYFRLLLLAELDVVHELSPPFVSALRDTVPDTCVLALGTLGLGGLGMLGLEGVHLVLLYIHGEKFNQPIFHCNNLSGVVEPVVPDDQHRALYSAHSFKILFKEGGCGTFIPLFFNLIASVRRYNQHSNVGAEPRVDPLQASQTPVDEMMRHANPIRILSLGAAHISTSPQPIEGDVYEPFLLNIASFTCGNEYSSDSDAKAVDVSDGIEDHAKELEHSSLQEKWDLDAVEELPQYMMICYMALYNPTNEIAYRVQRNIA
ncbi:UPF0664 stress-induced protein C29B12.11c [Senna tora]|uniref:UPF0664 stress-induced protein C29B12.11c n=1 Tax=Senna tora TaxID=362788 RepID=A0A835CBK2_9FABA|nr:UPF0664 stress-induced protein C29B12.11c [Senna tora]